MKVDIWHNIVWARYTGAIFGELSKLATAEGVELRFFQIAESELNRTALLPVDYSFHEYPFKLVFTGSYESVPLMRLWGVLAWEIMRSDADLVVLAGYHKIEFWIQLLVGRARGKQVGFFCDSTRYDRQPSRLRSLLKRLFFCSCHAAFCYGVRSKEYLIEHGFPPQRIFSRCQAAAPVRGYTTKHAIRQRVILADTSRIRILYVGRLSREKSLETLIRAFSMFQERHSSAELDLIGTGVEATRLQALSEELGIASAVQFRGSMFGDELVEMYQRATCLVLPSRSEPWGLVVNEALSLGCPVIVSDNCGCAPELVIDGQTGYRFEAGNADQLEERLEMSIAAFGDIEATAAKCVAMMSNYTPTAAARQIIEGCRMTIEAAHG